MGMVAYPTTWQLPVGSGASKKTAARAVQRKCVLILISGQEIALSWSVSLCATVRRYYRTGWPGVNRECLFCTDVRTEENSVPVPQTRERSPKFVAVKADLVERDRLEAEFPCGGVAPEGEVFCLGRFAGRANEG